MATPASEQAAQATESASPESGGRPPDPDPPSSSRRQPKSSIACDRCRAKKIKCDNTQPCKTCTEKQVECVFDTAGRKSRLSARARARVLEERLLHTSRLLRAAGIDDSSTSDLTWMPSLGAQNVHQHLSKSNTQQQQQLLDQSGALRGSETGHVLNHPIFSSVAGDGGLCQNGRPGGCLSLRSIGSGQSAAPSMGSATHAASFDLAQTSISVPPPSEPSLSSLRGHSGLPFTPRTGLPEHPSADTQRSSFIPSEVGQNSSPQANQDDIHGPGSYLSFCSEDALKWMAERIGPSDLRSTTSSLLSTINQKLRLETQGRRCQAAEPGEVTARLYVKAYYENSIESAFQTIPRRWFENCLEAHFRSPTPKEESPAWYAIRNVVYASGCKILLFQRDTWTHAQTESWKYFENALSVETRLLHGRSGLLGVQALLAMALFVEGAGGQKIEYMLVGCAMRLAQSMGLHLDPAPLRGALDEQERRRWIFWTLYCFEKHLALRSGRPSTVDDDDISCKVPDGAPDGDWHMVEFLRAMVQHAKISSSITKSFFTVKARQTPLQDMVKLVQRHHDALESWYRDLPVEYQQKPTPGPSAMPHSLHPDLLQYLYLSYHGSLSVIHCVFGYPWNVPSRETTNTQIMEQKRASSLALAEASRNIILATRSIVIGAVTPSWLIFHFPLIGMANLSITILQQSPPGVGNHDASTIASSKDDVLLDMISGYFGYLDYATEGAVSFPLTRNLVTWTRSATSRPYTGRGQEFQDPGFSNGHPTGQPGITDSSLSGCDDRGQADAHFLTEVTPPASQFEDFGGFLGTGFEEWPTYLPPIPHFVQYE